MKFLYLNMVILFVLLTQALQIYYKNFVPIDLDDILSLDIGTGTLFLNFTLSHPTKIAEYFFRRFLFQENQRAQQPLGIESNIFFLSSTDNNWVVMSMLTC